jgi:hypothetical protein
MRGRWHDLCIVCDIVAAARTKTICGCINAENTPVTEPVIALTQLPAHVLLFVLSSCAAAVLEPSVTTRPTSSHIQDALEVNGRVVPGC